MSIAHCVTTLASSATGGRPQSRCPRDGGKWARICHAAVDLQQLADSATPPERVLHRGFEGQKSRTPCTETSCLVFQRFSDFLAQCVHLFSVAMVASVGPHFHPW